MNTCVSRRSFTLRNRARTHPAAAHRSGSVDPFELELLSEKAAVEFLLERTKNRRVNDASDGDKVRELAKELDGLALGLEQAGAFISKMRCSFGGYLERRHAHEEKVRTRHDTRLMHYLFISRLELPHSPQHQLLTETNYSQFAALLHWSISHLIHYRVMHDRSKGVNSASGATGCFLC